jgi:hypothetical protein
MPVTITKVPVSADVDMALVPEIAAALSDLGDGEFVTTGQTFAPHKTTRKTKKGKTVEVDAGRAAANATAAKFIRVLESRYDVKLRSRTWQDADSQWTFGIRPKDEGEENDSPDES